MSDILWLQKLNRDLWPSGYSRTAFRELYPSEVERVCQCIEQQSLIAEMFMLGMFGGFGMRLYSQGPERTTFLQLTLTEDTLPSRLSLLDHLVDTPPPQVKKVPGCGREDAWELFSKYTHSERNKQWLRVYGLPESRDRVHYEY